MALTQLPGTQVKDSTIKNVDIASDAAIDISKLALPTTLTDKATPADADVFTGSDSAASNVWKKFSWSNIKAALKTYFDTIYTTGTAPIIRTKANHQDVLNSSTLINDNDLYFSALANTTYAIQVQLILRSFYGSNGGIKMSINTPAGASVEIGSLTVFGDPTTHVTASYNTGIDAYILGTQTGNGGTAEGSAHITAQVIMGSTAGTIQFRFAQATADNNGAIRLNKGSQMIAFKQ